MLDAARDGQGIAVIARAFVEADLDELDFAPYGGPCQANGDPGA